MDGNECVLCGDVAEHVHHRRYPDVLGDETVMDLVSLCGECHGRFHGKEAVALPKPAPPTREMAELRLQMLQAEREGDDGKAGELLSLYCTMRRTQVVGGLTC